jgi:PAS domain S-box-containing protein
LTSEPVENVAPALRLIRSADDGDNAAPTIDFQLIVEQSLNLVVFMDADGAIEYVNPRFCDLTGYSAAEVTGRRIHELGELPQEQAAEIWMTVSRGEPWRGEFQARNKDGDAYWVYSCISPITSPAGVVTNYLAVNLDITERKSIEATLEENESRLRAIAETNREVIWAADIATVVTYASPAVEAVLGYRAEDLLGQPCLSLLHPDDLAAYSGEFQSYVTESLGWTNVVTRWRHADGSWRHIESSSAPIVDEAGVVTGFQGSCRDVTDRVEAGRALRESEERFRSLTENLSDVISVVDSNGTIVYQSPSIERVLGYTAQERVGTKSFDYVHPDDESAARAKFAEMMTSAPGTVGSLSLRARHKDGSWRYLDSTVTVTVDPGGLPQVVVTSRDVTERRNAEADLQESEERFRALAATTTAAIFIFKGPRVSYANPAAESITGYTSSELRGLNFWDILHADIQESIEGTTISAKPQQVKIRRKDGAVRWVEYTTGFVNLSGRRLVLGTAFDVTERVVAEEALRESEASKQALLAAIPDLIFRQDRDGRYLEFVPGRFQPLLTPDLFIGKLMSDVLPSEVSDPAMAAFERVLASGCPETMEYDLTVAGEARTFEARMVPCAPDQVLSLVRDVTERKRMEAALRESEERLRTLLYNAPVILFAWDRDGYFIASEGKGLGPLGREAGQVVGQHITELYPEGSAIYENYCRALSGEVVTDEVEVGGRWFNASSAPLRNADGVVDGVIGVAIDITDRRAAEEALRQSEERLRLALEGAQLMTWEWELSTDVGTHTGGSYVNLGDVKSPYAWDDFMQSVVSEDRERVAEMVRRTMEEDAGYEVEFRVEPRKGYVRWIASRGAVVRNAAGEPLRLVGVAMDITGRKEAEEALRLSEERLRLALANAQMTAWEWDVERDEITNTATDGPLLSQSGRLAFDDFINRVHEGDRERVRDAVTRSLASGDFGIEFRVMWPDGDFHWVVASGTLVRDANNKPQRLFGVAMDLTERKAAEEALRESDERLRYLLHNAPIVLSAWDKDGKYELFEGKGLDEVGIPAGSLVGMNLRDVLPVVTGGDVMEGFQRALEGKVTLPQVKMGERWWTATSLPLTDKDGEAVGVIGVSVDITERKEAEDALRRSEERYRALYQDNPSMYFTVAEDGTVLSVNQFGAAQLGYTAEELIGNSVYEVFHKPDRPAVRKQFAELAANPVDVETWEFRKVRKDGQIVWVKETVRAIQDSEGSATFLVVCEDISERKSIEAAMEVMREQLERRAQRAVERGTQYGLSFRELTVLDLVAGGKSDKEIAVFLGIRPMTVSKHVANVLKKMSAASRAEAGVRAWREGLIR